MGMNKTRNSRKMCTKVWIILIFFQRVFGQDCTSLEQAKFGAKKGVRFSMGHTTRERADQRFVIYNKQAVITELARPNLTFNPDTIPRIFGRNSTSLLSKGISTTCRITAPLPTCIRFGQNGRRIPSPGAFVAMFYTNEGDSITPVETTNLFDSFCHYGSFQVYREKGQGVDAYAEMEQTFCSLRSTLDIDVVTETNNSVIYLSYEAGSDYQSNMATAFGLPVMADRPILVRCGVSLSRKKSRDKSEDHKTESIGSTSNGKLSTGMIVMAVMLCVAVVASSIAVPIVICCFRKKKEEPAGVLTDAGSERTSYKNIHSSLTVSDSYGLFLNRTYQESEDSSIYSEIPDDRTASDQSNRPAVTVPELPPLQTVQSIKKNDIEQVVKTDSESNKQHDYIFVIPDQDLYSVPKKTKEKTELMENDVYESSEKSSERTEPSESCDTFKMNLQHVEKTAETDDITEDNRSTGK